MQELDGVFFFTKAQNNVGPFAKDQMIEQLQYIMKERGDNIQSGAEFDNGIRTVDFTQDPHKVDIDEHYLEPELVAQDQFQGNWTGKRNK